MYTDTDTAMDAGMETFILIGPCGDLCRSEDLTDTESIILRIRIRTKGLAPLGYPPHTVKIRNYYIYIFAIQATRHTQLRYVITIYIFAIQATSHTQLRYVIIIYIFAIQATSHTQQHYQYTFITHLAC